MQCLSRVETATLFRHAGFIFGTAALAKTDAEATGKTVDKTEHKIDDDAGGPHGSQRILGSQCLSHDHGIRQGVAQLKQISKDHRDRKFQQGAERISDCQIHFFF